MRTRPPRGGSSRRACGCTAVAAPARSLVRAAELEARRAADHLHLCAARQALDDLLAHAVGEELHLAIVGEVVEGQHGEKRLAARGWRATVTAPRNQREGLDRLRHLVELEVAARDETFGQRAADGAAHVGRHQRRTGIAARHQAGRDVDAVAEQVAVRLHHDVAEMYADAHLGLALVRQARTRLRRRPGSSRTPA